MSGFVKLDTGILNSSIWIERDLRSMFVTALCMAEPWELKQATAQLHVDSLEATGWEVPPGWYGRIEASGTGIVRRDGIRSMAKGLAVLAQLCAPDPESRSQAFEGRRMARIDGGYLVLNYFAYRERDYRRKDPSGVADSYVYYAQSGDLIKIGVSKNPWARMSDLRVARPDVTLLAVERGDVDLEQLRHDQFRADRVGGEWFRLTESLKSHLNSVRSTSVATAVATKRTEAKAVSEAHSETEERKPPRVVLPNEATEFLTLFYEGPAMTEAARKRYANVTKQLYDVIDPLHTGVLIRGGQRVKARSVEHLADECRHLIKNPPPDRDLAIVWLLKRLTNPPKGPSVTEMAKRHEQEAINLEERYQRESKRAGVKWANDNPDEYKKIVAAVDASLHGAKGEYAKVARESTLIQRTAKAAGFPSFEQWQAQSHQPETTAA